MFLMQKNFLYLLILRWIMLAHVAILYVLGLDIGPPLIFLILICYTAILTALRKQITEITIAYPFLAYFDLAVTLASISFTGGSWKSPYYIYAYSSLMLLPLFMSLRRSLLATAGFSIFYTFDLAVNNQSVFQQALQHDIDSLISNNVAFFLTAIFFGYPASVIRKIEKTLEDTAIIKTNLDKTGDLLNALDPVPLSARELEVIRLLGTGRTNTQIAGELYITEKTVRNHLSNIYKKLGVSSRSEALIYYHSHISLSPLE